MIQLEIDFSLKFKPGNVVKTLGYDETGFNFPVGSVGVIESFLSSGSWLVSFERGKNDYWFLEYKQEFLIGTGKNRLPC